MGFDSCVVAAIENDSGFGLSFGDGTWVSRGIHAFLGRNKCIPAASDYFPHGLYHYHLPTVFFLSFSSRVSLLASLLLKFFYYFFWQICRASLL